MTSEFGIRLSLARMGSIASDDDHQCCFSNDILFALFLEVYGIWLKDWTS